MTRGTNVRRYLAMTYRRHWRMELFILLQVAVIVLLVTLMASARSGYHSQGIEDPFYTYFTYIVLGVAGICGFTLLTNLLVNSERLKRRQAVCVICGMPAEDIALSEAVKYAVNFTLGTLLAFLVIAAAGGNEQVRNILSVSYAWYGVLTALFIQAASCFFAVWGVRRLRITRYMNGK